MKRKFLALFAVMLFAAQAHALELTLEENRGESGSIGYVDIERIFAEHPETLKAKEEFKTEIKIREDLINRRKQEIFNIKAELNKLRQEREFRKAFPVQITPPAASAPVEAPPQEIPAGVVVSSAADSDSDAVSVSTAAAPAPVAAEAKLSSAAASVDIDARIAEKEKELQEKEKALKSFQKTAEKELLQMEGRRSEIILGRIYFILKDIAVSQGLSVVVDSKTILYGQTAVDLTDDLLVRLKMDLEKPPADAEDK